MELRLALVSLPHDTGGIECHSLFLTDAHPPAAPLASALTRDGTRGCDVQSDDNDTDGRRLLIVLRIVDDDVAGSGE